MRLIAVSILALFAIVSAARVLADDAAASKAGGTEIAKWPDGKKACFMLAFDDGAPSQLEHVVPALIERKIVGNFYLNTGKEHYKALHEKWEAAVKSPYISIANHTFTHTGATDPATLDKELSKNNDVLYSLHPERKRPYLLGFGKPGGVPWTVSDDELNAALAKNTLIDRPPFLGPPIHYKSAAESTAVIDKAIAGESMGHLDFHGVGGDWLTTPLDWFDAILDKIERRREELWVTDVVSWHQYVRERDATKVEVEVGQNEFRVTLASDLDKELYQLPLSLVTKVPADWKHAVVKQGGTGSEVQVENGQIRYHGVPGHEAVVITRK